MENGASSAFVVYKNNTEIFNKTMKLSKNNSIYQAELVALEKSIQWIIDSDVNKVIIYIDSNSSIESLKRLFPTNETVKTIFTDLVNNSNKQIYISWIKAHVGYIFNERADHLAKEVIISNTYDSVIKVPYPISLLKNKIEKLIINAWQDYWDNSTKGRDTYLVLNKVNQDYISRNQILKP